MRILITTGIYPPKVGGPSQYAKNLFEVWQKAGHEVLVRTYTIENSIPTGIRHIWFFLKIIPAVLKSDFVLSLDTYSVGFPSVFASKIFGKKVMIRTGGDFLWESYVERTRERVLFRNFYEDKAVKLNLKEKVIFSITKWTLKNANKLIFSTNWQRDIFVKAYQLDIEKTSIIENYYGQKESSLGPNSKDFIASTRNLYWKNLDVLKKIFVRIVRKNSQVKLYTLNTDYDSFMERMRGSFAVVLVSLGDISPNMILDAIRLNKPFICTKEVGIFDRIKDAGIFVDPLNENEIEEAVLKLLNPEEYSKAKEKVKNFNFTHTWEEICNEFITIYNSIE
ncbi:MAG: glycosyltransferase family 4 protein [Minisyncoccia bacterium]